MNTSTLLWFTIAALCLLFGVLASIIWALIKQLRTTENQLAEAQEQQQHHYVLAESFKAQNLQLKLSIDEQKVTSQQLQVKLEQSQVLCNKLSNQYTLINTTLKQKEQHFAEQIILLSENRAQLKLEFEQLAGQIFEAKGKTFSEQSNQSLQALLAPFREQLTGFKHKVEDIHHKQTIQKTQLTDELKHLKELNQQITQETHELTLALKGDKKMQGNWGELILENVLERAGLQIHKDFELQTQIRSAEGDPQMPDVIINLPQGKHLIIDAKVSLNAYTRAVNADSEEQQSSALNEHIKAVKQRIKELSERYYYSSPDINSPEIIIMFIPIEPAFIAAFKADEALFQKAIEKNILVATPTTLLACLTIVRQLWRLENQTKNTIELTKSASKVYDKLRLFLSSMDEIESNLQKAQMGYRKAKGQLVDGKGNLVKLVDDFLELGVAVKNEIPSDWKEKAALGLTVTASAVSTVDVQS